MTSEGIKTNMSLVMPKLNNLVVVTNDISNFMEEALGILDPNNPLSPTITQEQIDRICLIIQNKTQVFNQAVTDINLAIFN